jgi:hypothetical protein
MEEAAHPVAAGLVPAPHRRTRQDAPCEQTDAGIAQPLQCVTIGAVTQRRGGAATRAAATAR